MTTLVSAVFDVAFQDLLRQFGRLSILTSTIRSMTKRQHAELRKSADGLREQGLGDLPLYAHNMWYRDIDSDVRVFYEYTEHNFKELEADLVSYRNRQHQWILVEAFELFEQFVDACRSEMSAYDPSLLDPRDPSLLDRKYSKELAGKINSLRTRLPGLVRAETSNARDLNYRSCLAVIELLRHIVVHEGGRVQNEERFFEKLAQKAQKHNGGMHIFGVEDVARDFLTLRSGKTEVFLLEDPTAGQGRLHVDRLASALDWLLTYSSCLYAEAVKWSSGFACRKP